MKGMVTNMWAYESVFYQIYPMGFCGVPFENDGVQRHEIKRVEDWIPHMQKLGVNAVYFSPVPCQRISGGMACVRSASTGMEWPWLARINVWSSL